MAKRVLAGVLRVLIGFYSFLVRKNPPLVGLGGVEYVGRFHIASAAMLEMKF